VIKLRGQPASGYDALRGLPGAIKQHNKETNRQGKDVDLSTADHHTVGFHPWLNIGSARWLNIGSAPTLGHVIERGTARRPHLLVEAFHLGGRNAAMA
jgi:hypothetical protein